MIGPAELPAGIREYKHEPPVTATGHRDELITLAEVERRYIREVLEATRNNKTDAARILGIDRRSLYRRLHENDDASQPSSDDN